MSTLIHQYKTIKAKYPEAILLFRIGDHYEIFNEDAIIIAEKIGVTLYHENTITGIHATASLHFHALDKTLRTLTKLGHKVAVCEELEEPKCCTTIKRGVTDVSGF